MALFTSKSLLIFSSLPKGEAHVQGFQRHYKFGKKVEGLKYLQQDGLSHFFWQSEEQSKQLFIDLFISSEISKTMDVLADQNNHSIYIVR